MHTSQAEKKSSNRVTAQNVKVSVMQTHVLIFILLRGVLHSLS